jgi:hypothetical protein
MQTITHAIFMRACGAAVLASLAASAWAGAAPGTDAAARTAAARALFRPENAVGAHAGAPARADASGAALARQRGGTDTRNDMRLDGSVAANTAVNVVTGANSIDAGSFANMAGIPVVIQNSGANVLIQSATIINLQFK